MGANKIKLATVLIIPLFSVGAFFNEYQKTDIDSGANPKQEISTSNDSIEPSFLSSKDPFAQTVKVNKEEVEIKENSDENISANKNEKEEGLIKEVKTDPIKKTPPKKIIIKTLGVSGPILSETRIVNGKNVCKDINDKPKKSKKTKKIHVDAECCLDPDEIPNSNCYYSPEKYGSLINKYLKGKK